MSPINELSSKLQVSVCHTPSSCDLEESPPRICGFEFSPDSNARQSRSPRYTSVPESPLGRELRNAGLVGLPALPKLNLRVSLRTEPTLERRGLRGFQSAQHLPNIEKQQVQQSNSCVAQSAYSSSSCTSVSDRSRSSPIDTPRIMHGRDHSASSQEAASLTSFARDGTHPAQLWWRSQQDDVLHVQDKDDDVLSSYPTLLHRSEQSIYPLVSPQGDIYNSTLMSQHQQHRRLAACHSSPCLADYAFEMR